MSFASAKVMIDSISIKIMIVSYKFFSEVVKHVKIFYLKLSKINLNTILKIIVFAKYL